MELDIDTLLQEEPLKIKVGGKSYLTRPIVLADVAWLQKVVSSADKDVEPIRKLVGGFFADPRPDCAQWTMTQTLATIKGLLLYWKRNAEKNCESVSAKVEAEMDRLMSGSSTPPS